MKIALKASTVAPAVPSGSSKSSFPQTETPSNLYLHQLLKLSSHFLKLSSYNTLQMSGLRLSNASSAS